MTHILGGPRPSNMRFFYFMMFAAVLLGGVALGIKHFSNRIPKLTTISYQSPYDGTIERLTETLQKDPTSVPTLIERGNAYFAKGADNDAVNDFNRALELSPDDATALDDRCNVHLAMRAFDLTIADCSRALQIGSPDQTHSLLTRAAAYSAKSLNALAVEDLSNAIRRSPGMALLYIVRGMVYEDTGKLEESKRDIAHAASIDPRAPFLLVSRGMLAIAEGRYWDAIPKLEAAVKRDPTNSVGVIWLHLAKIHEGQDDTAEFHVNSLRLAPDAWPSSVAALFDHRGTTDGVLAQAKISDPSGIGVQECQANFYIGQFDLTQNDRLNAKSALHDAMTGCPGVVNIEKQASIRTFSEQNFDPRSPLENP